jgi:hypothetical protein
VPAADPAVLDEVDGVDVVAGVEEVDAESDGDEVDDESDVPESEPEVSEDPVDAPEAGAFPRLSVR